MPTTDITGERISLNLGDRPAATERLLQQFPFPGRVLDGGFLKDPALERINPAGPHQDGNHEQPSHGDKGEPDYIPELVCRTFVGDSGARPLAPTITFWESPDVWVVAPDGSDSPIAGVINQVNVHVWNLGMAPAYGVLVELYWCDPSVGVNLALATQIGMTQQITLTAGQHTVLTFDWTPTFVNDGHECLVVQVYDPVADNLVAPFNPLQDRHVAQHNINNVRVQQGHQIHLQFFAPNLSPLVARSEIRIEALRSDALQTFALGLGYDFLPEATGADASITNVQVGEAHPTIDLAKHPAAAVFRESLEPVPQRLIRTLLEGALNALPTSNEEPDEPSSGWAGQSRHATHRSPERQVVEPQTLAHAYDIRPGQELALTLTITLSEHARAGAYHAYRVIEQVEGRITGGITYLVNVG